MCERRSKKFDILKEKCRGRKNTKYIYGLSYTAGRPLVNYLSQKFINQIILIVTARTFTVI